MDNKIKVIVVDDHTLVRQGILSMLEDCGEIEIAGQAQDGKELEKLLSRVKPDIILMDISLPGQSGIDITRKLQAAVETNAIGIIIISMFTQEEFILESLKAGARGYLPKNTTRHELMDAIQAVYAGREYFSPLISGIIMKSLIKSNEDNNQVHNGPDAILSKREIEILTLFAQGLSNPEIADKLFISIRTVESHKNHIMQKLDLRNSVDLVKYAIRHKLIDV